MISGCFSAISDHRRYPCMIVPNNKIKVIIGSVITYVRSCFKFCESLSALVAFPCQSQRRVCLCDYSGIFNSLILGINRIAESAHRVSVLLPRQLIVCSLNLILGGAVQNKGYSNSNYTKEQFPRVMMIFNGTNNPKETSFNFSHGFGYICWFGAIVSLFFGFGFLAYFATPTSDWKQYEYLKFIIGICLIVLGIVLSISTYKLLNDKPLFTNKVSICKS